MAGCVVFLYRAMARPTIGIRRRARGRDVKPPQSEPLDAAPGDALGAPPTVPAVARGARRPGGLPTNLPLHRQVATLALWPMLEQLMTWLVWAVDTSLAGHLPTAAAESTNAVGAASYWIWLMQLVIGAVGVGATAMIARAVGARHRREANAVLGQSLTVAAALGVITGVFFFVTAEWIGLSSRLEGLSLDLSTMYARLLSSVAPFFAVLFIGAAALRGAGDFRSPFLVMVAVNVVNAAASILLVVGPEPVGGHGLRGIAIGTMIAWFVGALLMVGLLIRGRGGIRLHLHRLRPERTMVRRLMRVGVPNLFEGMGYWLAAFAVLILVGKVHPDAVGSHMIAIRIEGLSFLPGFALSLAAATMVGQYLGAGDVRMARRSAWVCLAYGGSLMFVLGLAFILVPEALVRLMTNEPVFLAEVPVLLRIAGFAQIGFAAAMILNGAMRGAGDTLTVMVLSFGSLFLFRVPAVWVAVEWFDAAMPGIWIICSADLMVRGGLSLARFLHGGWAHVKV